MEPRISVVIAAYRPGDGFDRVIGSLDAQTLPQEEFETIVVDDGSPDRTFDRLSELAAVRRNMRVHRIENSGWPSRPRNVGTDMARGEWVLFMDHDDALYPDALRRMAEYAAETGADVLSPKESKTNDTWWGGAALRQENLPDAIHDGGIEDLLPMVPHKLYRRAFLEEHHIRFPEGRRQFWEDIYVNVEAWRHAERVAVLADTPAYLWYSSGSNSSKSYGPVDAEFWDRLDDLFAFIDRTLEDEAHAEARRSAMLQQYRTRVLNRFSKSLRGASTAERTMALERARALQARYVPEEWDALLGTSTVARSVLLRAGRADLLERLWTIDAATAAPVTAVSAGWRDGALRLDLVARWRFKGGGPVTLRRRGDRLLRDLPEEVLAALPERAVDLTDRLGSMTLRLGVRDRPDYVTWLLPHEDERRWEPVDADTVTPLLAASAVLDPLRAAGGDPLLPHPHDVVANVRWEGEVRTGKVRFHGSSAPAMIGSRPAVAYRSEKGTLALDLSGTLRNPFADGGPGAGRVAGTLRRLVMPLPRISTTGPGAVPAAIRLTPVGRGGPIEVAGTLQATAERAVFSTFTGPQVPAGEYEAAFRTGDGPFIGPRPARVRGAALTLLPRGGQPHGNPVRGALGRLRRRLRP